MSDCNASTATTDAVIFESRSICTNDQQAAALERGSSASPLNFEDWCGDVELSQGDIDEINLAAFAVASAGDNRNKSGRESRNSAASSVAPAVTRRKKKCKGFPKRPLSGYNIFFKKERVNVLEEHKTYSASAAAREASGQPSDASVRTASVSFQDLGKIIGRRWKALSDEDRKKYEEFARRDSVRYRSEMEVYNETKRKRNEEKMKEATSGPTRDATSALPNAWSTMVLSGPPELLPLFHQSQPLAARLPSGHHHQPTHPEWQQRAQPEWQLQPACSRHEGAALQTADASNFLLPPGTEIVLPDPQGGERTYKVQYKFYSMTRQTAETYLQHLSTSATATPYGFTEHPPPPPGSRDSHYPYWS